MTIAIFLQQLRRGRGRTLLSVLLLCALTAFFVISVNLYQASTANLAEVERNYETVAYLKFYGNINKRGELTDPGAEDSIGKQAVGQYGFDLTPILESEYVLGHDLRVRCGAYIPGEIAMARRSSYHLFLNMNYISDVIRFRLLSEEPVVAGSESQNGSLIFCPFEIEILDHANKLLDYGETTEVCDYSLKSRVSRIFQRQGASYAVENAVEKFNESEIADRIILYPDTEYIAVINDMRWSRRADSGLYQYEPCIERPYPQFSLTYLQYMAELPFAYRENGSSGEVFGLERFSYYDQPTPIQRWADVQNDSALLEWFQTAWDLATYNACSRLVISTNDIEGISYFQISNCGMKQGRFITVEEYENGAKVCVISDIMADMQGWAIGDKLDIRLFEDERLPFYESLEFNEDAGVMEAYIYGQSPHYRPTTDGFFDGGEYEIIGIYQRSKAARSSTLSPSTTFLPWSAILIPKNSASGRPTRNRRSTAAC